MAEPEATFLSMLNEQEKIHFRNLTLIRPQSPSEGQLNLIEGLARNLSHPRLLTLIARTPHWLVHAPILYALVHNESTPEAIRGDLELAVSLHDLMQAMDRSPEKERREMEETVKGLFDQLPLDLKPVVKQLLKQKAKQVKSGVTQAILPPVPDDSVDWETLTTPPTDKSTRPITILLSREEQLDRAATTHIEGELRAALFKPDAEIRNAALHNPMISEEFLVKLIPECPTTELFEDIYGEARWYFRDSIREALYHSPFLPDAFGRKFRVTSDLIIKITEGSKSRKTLHQIVCLFFQLEDSEYQYLTLWAKQHYPSILRVIKLFYDRLQRKRSVQISGLGSQNDTRWDSLEDRVFTATQSNQPEQLIASLRDPDMKVFSIVLENPMLTPQELLSAIPTLETQKVELLAVHRLWSENLAVVEALLHNINLSVKTALKLLNALDTPKALLDLLRDTRIPHIEIKEQALESLKNLYKVMSLPQRIVALRSSGGELIRHLPLEIFKDEEALEQLLADRQVDPSILHRLARNRQTPRSVLEGIARHPTLLAHPPIMSELLLNPKTPKEPAMRLWALLSESEQSQLLKNPHLPVALKGA